MAATARKWCIPSSKRRRSPAAIKAKIVTKATKFPSASPDAIYPAAAGVPRQRCALAGKALRVADWQRDLLPRDVIAPPTCPAAGARP